MPVTRPGPVSPFRWVLRFSLLLIGFLVCFVIGSLPVARLLPDGAASEPGLVPAGIGLLIIAAVNVLVIAAVILTSRWAGWRLAISVALAYYGAVTLLPQIETWYFLAALTVDRRLLPWLFVMGIPTAFVFVPLAVRVVGRWRGGPDTPADRVVALTPGQWVGRLAALALAYVALYWLAGYFIAWQNPELRAFYGRPGEAVPFLTHTADSLRREPGLFLLQVLRALLWVACALPVMLGSRVSRGWTALVVALLFSAPQNVGHILSNPLMPLASVRSSHLVETASSTFVFGLLVVLWTMRR